MFNYHTIAVRFAKLFDLKVIGYKGRRAIYQVKEGD